MSLVGVLRRPGVAGPMAGSMLGTMSVTGLGLLLLLHVEHLTDRFAVAGLASAAFALGLAVSAPVVGRIMDRRGQVGPMVVMTVAVVVVLVTIAALPESAPTALIVVLALLTGLAMPPGGSNVRAIWSTNLDADDRHAVFALHSAGIEAMYAVGPAVLAGGLGTWNSRVALVVSAAVLLAGIVLYVTRPAVRAWRGAAREHHSFFGPLTSGPVRTVLLTLLAVGVGFGSIEVGVAAVAEAADARGAAGLLLAVWAVGSMLGGLYVASRPAPTDPARSLAVRFGLLTLAQAFLTISTNPWVLAPLLLVAGVLIAPSLTGAMALVGDLAPPGTLTEAYSWTSCAIGGGLAAGAAVGGVLAEQTVRGPFLQAVVAIALGTALAAARRRQLTPA